MVDTYLTRQTLLKRLKLKLDESSWDEFTSFYGAFIRSVIRRFGASRSDVEDIFQEVMLKIWNSIAKFNAVQKKGSFRNWVFTITKHTTLKYIAKKKSKEQRRETLEETSVDGSISPEIDKLIDEEWNKHITSLAFEIVNKKVSKKAMDVFTAQFHNESAEQTAERLGIELTTVYIYRGRVKERLKAEVKNLKEMLE